MSIPPPGISVSAADVEGIVMKRLMPVKKQVADLQEHVECELHEVHEEIKAKIRDNQAIHKRVDTNTNVDHSKAQDTMALLREINSGIQAVSHRCILHEKRSKYQHQMLYNAIKKVAKDLKEIKSHSNSDAEMDVDSSPSLRSPGRTRAMENRQNFELALDHYVETMNKTNDLAELKNAGDLAVKYSNELFKNLL